MTWRIDKSVIKGEINNRTKGRVTGRLWLVGREEPVELNLAGNCWRDLAGMRFTFVNASPAPGQRVDLAGAQEGLAGDITASRKVFDVPEEDIPKIVSGEKKGKDYPMANAFYLEWFSRANGRVVIESTRFRIETGERAWTLTREEEREQHGLSRQAMEKWMDDLIEAMEDHERYDPGQDKPMDEFEWEKFMKESDRRTDKYMETLEKYKGHPDQERLVAREMGWTWLDDALEEEEKKKQLGLDDEEDGEDLFEDVPELVPNPLTEGTDWVRDRNGRVQHPLVLRVNDMSLAMWQEAKRVAGQEESWDPALQDMVANTQIAGAKLAGALNHLAYDEHPDAGFVVAAVKRALNYLHQSIAASDRLAQAKVVPQAFLDHYRQDLFAAREESLAILQKYRRMSP